MKFYAKIAQENEEDQLIVFDLDVARVADAVRCCKLYNYYEVCFDLPDFERIVVPEDPILDGFVSQHLQDELVSEFGGLAEMAGEPLEEGPAYDLKENLLQLVHVTREGGVAVEVRGGPAGEWWSEGVNLEEIDLWLTK